MSLFDPSLFGDRAAHVTLHEVQAEAEARAVAEAKELLRQRLLRITADHEGKYLNQRNFDWAMGLLESL